MSGSRGNSESGANPAAIVDQDAALVAPFRRQRDAAERNASTTIPVDMLADPVAAREAIRAKYGNRLRSERDD